MPTPIEAARTAVDELMEVAAALAFHEWPDGDTKKQVQLVLTKARTAGAALEAMTAGTEPHPPEAGNSANLVSGPEQRDAERAKSNRLRTLSVPIVGSEPSQEAELFPNQKPAGSAVSYGTVKPPKKERGGPKDADKAPGVFKAEFGEGSGQIHPVANFHHCELCGIRLDLPRQDPCQWTDCPNPRPQDQRA